MNIKTDDLEFIDNNNFITFKHKNCGGILKNFNLESMQCNKCKRLLILVDKMW